MADINGIVDTISSLTLGEAAGKLLANYIDKTPITLAERRNVLMAIPAECRFINKNHELATITIIQAVLDYANTKPRPTDESKT